MKYKEDRYFLEEAEILFGERGRRELCPKNRAQFINY
jgi:hypothetical protein